MMLVLALIAIVTVIAVPTYQDAIDRAKVTRAVADIGTLSLQLSRWEARTGAFPPTLAAAGLDGLLDPWKRPYEYLNVTTAAKGAVRKNKNLVPINTDFDLYSMGKDGASAAPLTAATSRDDIVRANNGAYLGRADAY
jgi:general secretion pathway protein G